jgi:hypothetical protein
MRIQEVINSYITNPRRQGALMINGPWGIGKSYFWSKKMQPEIENILGYSCVYVSLNGINSVDDISREIFFQRVFKLKSEKRRSLIGRALVTIFSNMASNIYKVDPLVIGPFGKFLENSFKGVSAELVINFSKVVICFDDLERISEKVTVKEVLGYINSSYIETKKIPCIIIANEVEIFEKEVFDRVKEKTIFRTINMEGNQVTISEFIAGLEVDERLSAFLTSVSGLLERYMGQFNEVNLRTLNSVVDVLCFLCQLYPTIFDRSELEDPITLFVVLISLEFKSGRLTANDVNSFKMLDKIDSKDDFSSFSLTLRDIGNSASSDSGDYEYTKAFYSRYKLESIGKFFLFKSVYNFILSGNLDDQLFQQDMEVFNVWYKGIVRQRTKPHYESLNNLHTRYRFDTQEKLETDFTTVLQAATDGKFQFYDYGMVHKTLIEQVELELVVGDKQQIYSKCLSGLRLALRGHEIEPVMVTLIRARVSKASDKEMDDLISTEFDRMEQKTELDEVDRFFDLVAYNFQDFLTKGYSYFNPLKKIDAISFFKRIEYFKISQLLNLELYFDSIKASTHVLSEYLDSKKRLEALVNILEKELNNFPFGLHRNGIKSILYHIIRIIDLIEKEYSDRSTGPA